MNQTFKGKSLRVRCKKCGNRFTTPAGDCQPGQNIRMFCPHCGSKIEGGVRVADRHTANHPPEMERSAGPPHLSTSKPTRGNSEELGKLPGREVQGHSKGATYRYLWLIKPNYLEEYNLAAADTWCQVRLAVVLCRISISAI